ncbi:MAG TPA: sigma-70 family RNA polymerase sigma factor [Anaerolineae bacterium]|nr:sigma-70 family RNA polymerase sigma factor [Anaerolineae bacterium]
MRWNSLVLPHLRVPEQIEQGTAQRTKHSKSRTEYSKNGYRSDPRLVQACLDGDQAAWNTLVERYQWLVFSIARRYGLAQADAEDVMQNVFLIVYRRLETLRDYTLLSSWLIRITHRETLHYLKKGPQEQDQLDEMSDEQTMPVDQVQRLELQHAVRQALAQLDPHCRALLDLFLSSASPSYEEIAACLGCPIGSIGPTRARCFKKLESILREMGVDVVA